MRILVTGASGFIGRHLCPFLRSHGFTVRAFGSAADGVDEMIEGRLEDLSALRRASAGVDTVIHLAACAEDADFVNRLVPANVIGLFHAFEAARLEGVRRFILASSCQATDATGCSRRITVTDRRPADHYGLTKLWAEEMGELYSRTHRLPVLAIRLGWVVRNQAELADMRNIPGATRLYLSVRDLRDFFLHALRTDLESFAVVYALSRQSAGELFDMEPARRLLAFEPQDTFPDGLTFALS